LKATACVCAFATAIGCAQLTGLSDDYTFDAPEPDAGRDGASGDAAPTCSAAQRDAAQRTFSANGGDAISATCKTCLAQNCCVEVAQCGGDTTCSASMRCVFGCQQAANRVQCARDCRSAFDTVIGTCEQQHCPICSFR
jgi:hypothetical protein